MNEFLRSFIMTGIRDMVNKDVALYQTYQYASGWFSKNVLIQEDLEEIEKLYEEKAMQETIETTEVVEEIVEETENTETVAEVVENTEVENIVESEEV